MQLIILNYMYSVYMGIIIDMIVVSYVSASVLY